MGLKYCSICVDLYKKSKEGRRQRKLRVNRLPYEYGPGKWPAWTEREPGSKFCAGHTREMKEKVKRAYADREINCKALGFKSYKGYLKSELWASIRTKKFTESKGVCFKCGRPADAIHHSSYTLPVLKGENMKKLHAVCNDCHNRMEYFSSKDKASPSQTMRGLRKHEEHYHGGPVKIFTPEEIEEYQRNLTMKSGYNGLHR